MADRSEVYLAADFGAESGRVMAGLFDGKHLRLEEAHRFPNEPVALPDALHWDALRLYREMTAGLARAARAHGRRVVSLGVDTWGVDFGLLDRRGALLANPVHYRDGRTAGMLERAFRKARRERIYRRTGLQFMEINTLYQLLALARARAPELDAARTLLFMPDLFHYWLTGRRCNEWTIASTSQCFDPRRKAPARALLRELGIPAGLFAEVVEAGTKLGALRPGVADETGLARCAVVAPGSHDTASAVAAVPADAAAGPFAYLSSGTWSLMGIETDRPRIDQRTLASNMTNEGGVCGTNRLLKNIMGLWILQECRRAWQVEDGGTELSYDRITRLASKAAPFQAAIDPLDSAFLAPGRMPERIRAWCRRTGQRPPGERGDIARVVFESLALAYRRVFDQLEAFHGGRIETLHIVGGGSRNALLNQFTADAIGRPVVAGPVEATAAGNILMQLLARRRIRSLAEGRALVARSFERRVFEPRDESAWAEAYARFSKLA